jgi:hypothetical protein
MWARLNVTYKIPWYFINSSCNAKIHVTVILWVNNIDSKLIQSNKITVLNYVIIISSVYLSALGDQITAEFDCF